MAKKIKKLSRKPVKKQEIRSTQVTDSYSKAWRLVLSNFLILLAVVLISFAIDALSSISDVGILQFALAVLVSGPIGMSMRWVFLRAARKEKFKLTDMFAVFTRNYWNAVLAGLLVMIFVILGFILLIIPGIVIAIRLSFVDYLIVDKKMSALDAIKESWKLTKGYAWKIFGFSMLALLFVIGGLVLLVLPVFFAMVWISAAHAILYLGISMQQSKQHTI